MYKKLFWTVALAFAFLLSQNVSADSWGCGKGLKEMVESLKLDDTQKAKIKPVLEQLRTTMKDNGAQMKTLDTQINQQADSEKADQSAVNNLIDKKAQLIGNMMKAKMAAKTQIYTVLNANQKAELNTMVNKMEEDMRAQFKKCHNIK